MECEMQVKALSSIMLMNIYIKIKKVLNYFWSRLLKALHIKHKVCNLLYSKQLTYLGDI